MWDHPKELWETSYDSCLMSSEQEERQCSLCFFCAKSSILLRQSPSSNREVPESTVPGPWRAAAGFIVILDWLIPRHYHLLGHDDFPNSEILNFSDSIWNGLLSVICESEGRWKPSWLKLAKKVKENNIQGGVSCWVSGADPVPPSVAGDSLNFFFNRLCLSKETQNSLFWQNRPVHVPEPPTVLGVKTSHSVSKYAEMLA